MAGDRNMYYASRPQLDDRKDKDSTKQDVVGLHEIAGPDRRGVITQEGSPGLTAWSRDSPPPFQVLLDGALGKRCSQFQQLPADALRAPRAILGRQSADQRDLVTGQCRTPTRCLRAGFAPPDPAEQVAVPAQQRLGF
jgi:hypothetical protein